MLVVVKHHKRKDETNYKFFAYDGCRNFVLRLMNFLKELVLVSQLSSWPFNSQQSNYLWNAFELHVAGCILMPEFREKA